MRRHANVEWTAIADMMSGLMVIFLLLALSFISEAQEKYDHYVHIHEKLYAELLKEFEVDLKKWNAEIEKDTLALRFNEPDILFENGSADPNALFKAIIKNFFPRYIGIVEQPEFKDRIEEIRIEGHTSSKGRIDQSDVSDKYYYNLKLSQERARNVLVESMESFDRKKDWKTRQWLRGKLTANGLSSSKLITRSGDSRHKEPIEDETRSRRVEFRVKIKSDELIKSLKFGKQDEAKSN